MPPRTMEPRATLSAERHSARFNLRSRSVFTSRAGETAPIAPRRNSIPTNVETPNKRKPSNKTGEDVELSGAAERDRRSQDEQGKRGAKKTLGGQRGNSRSCEEGGHGPLSS